MGIEERPHPSRDWQKSSSTAAAGSSGNVLLPVARLGPFPAQQIMPRADFWSLVGSHSATSIKCHFKVRFCCLAILPAPFLHSNLSSFLNISWTAYMHSCTKIFLKIETIITLHSYTTFCTRSFCLSSLASLLPKGKCINGKKKTAACKQPQEQENSVLITRTENASPNSIRNRTANLD